MCVDIQGLTGRFGVFISPYPPPSAAPARAMSLRVVTPLQLMTPSGLKASLYIGDKNCSSKITDQNNGFLLISDITESFDLILNIALETLQVEFLHGYIIHVYHLDVDSPRSNQSFRYATESTIVNDLASLVQIKTKSTVLDSQSDSQEIATTTETTAINDSR